MAETATIKVKMKKLLSECNLTEDSPEHIALLLGAFSASQTTGVPLTPDGENEFKRLKTCPDLVQTGIQVLIEDVSHNEAIQTTIGIYKMFGFDEKWPEWSEQTDMSFDSAGLCIMCDGSAGKYEAMRQALQVISGQRVDWHFVGGRCHMFAAKDGIEETREIAKSLFPVMNQRKEQILWTTGYDD